ncbi:hypothetical protein PORY_001320 [Pneumocystis oryctolagi]|uniref:Uncharacterized protein n=1 Tax=Pneumocystis oryctolagi TaxID=42067 RepID=A0ACB7CCD6_9ASCO|nr:hypothetical protein PORY_001320 [Pneumocystis oryctolagi]
MFKLFKEKEIIWFELAVGRSLSLSLSLSLPPSPLSLIPYIYLLYANHHHVNACSNSIKSHCVSELVFETWIPFFENVWEYCKFISIKSVLYMPSSVPCCPTT